MWIVYTEIHTDSDVERWYYGVWDDHNRANEVAIALGNNYPVFHCVCSESDANKLGIQNMYR